MKNLIRYFFFGFTVFLVFIAAPVVYADSVLMRSGNIFFKAHNAKELQLTRSGHDSEPILSADGKWVVFVREVPNKPDSLNIYAEKNHFAKELWLVTSDGKLESQLVRYGAIPINRKDIRVAGIGYPQFFADNHRIAFVGSLAVVEGAVYIVDIQTRKVQFVTPGNSLEVVVSGEYKNYLIVQRHKYFMVGGTYDWYWLLDVNGKEIDVIGDEENLKLFREMYLESKTK